ncbi:MAG: hypothetical protein VKP70_06875 [Cyanobacteriota bacterium]|nr:hypothetical protein [Cyanobacteriota bacterium]
MNNKPGPIKLFVSWLKNNPVQSAIGSALVLVGVPMINGYYQNVFLPNLIPLNVVTKVTATNPSIQKAYRRKNGTVFSPLELAITVENPSKKKLYLLKSVWVAEVCSFVDHHIDQNLKDEKNFLDTIQQNNQPYKDDTSQIYEGYSRACRFIGTGRLLRDASISPLETISSQLVVVYPTRVPFYQNALKDVDLIRITTYIPSMTEERNDLRALLFFTQMTGTPPDGMLIWAKREKGNLNKYCTLEATSPENESFNQNIVGPAGEIKTIKNRQQVWCVVTDADKEYEKVNITRSVTETWLRDRMVN